MDIRSLRRSLVAVLTCSTLVAGCTTSAPRTSHDRSSADSAPFEYTLDEIHPLPSSGAIRLTSEDARVYVSGSDRTDVRIQVNYRIKATQETLSRFSYRVNARQVGDELWVAEERHTGSRNFSYDPQDHVIRIEVPRRTHVTIHEEDGTCEITGIEGRVDVSMDDGNARLADCSGAITVALDGGTVTQTNCATLRYERR